MNSASTISKAHKIREITSPGDYYRLVLNNLFQFSKKNWDSIFTFLLFCTDILFVNLSFYIAIYLRYYTYINPFDYWQPWLFVNIIFFPVSICFGLYRGIFKASLEKQKFQIEKVTFYVGILTMAFLYMIKGDEYSRAIVIIFLMAMYVILELNHSLLSKVNIFMVKKGIGSKNTLIMGSDESAYRFSEQLKDTYGDFYQIKGFVKNKYVTDSSDVVPHIIGTCNDINTIIREKNIHQVFIVSDSMNLDKYTSVRKACERYGINLKMVSPHIKNLMKKRKIKDVTGVPLVTESTRSRYLYYQKTMKRILDILCLMAGGIIIVPAGILIALLIKLTSKGPVFFKQKRSLYLGGPEFWFLKFRSMCIDADKLKGDLLTENESNGALFKIKKDPRITPVGRIIRKFSLDEFPQFINVLKGEMSIVGPRPLPVKDYKMLKNTDSICCEWYKKRGNALPGITGLWQISGRNELSFEEMCLLDLYYIENQSVFFDLEIMFETVYVMLFGRGY